MNGRMADSRLRQAEKKMDRQRLSRLYQQQGLIQAEALGTAQISLPVGIFDAHTGWSDDRPMWVVDIPVLVGHFFIGFRSVDSFP